MTYTGNICDGCGKAFTENDDVVVCPECATPQHRECYEKNNSCVNSHLHGEFEWKGTATEKKPLFFKKEEAPKEKTAPCPNCGYENPEGSKQCRQCGMKLMVFGIDLATEIKQQNEPENKNTPAENGIPHYEPPFTFGVGEGFTQDEEIKAEEASEAQPENSFPMQENPGFTNNSVEGAPMPPSPQENENSIIHQLEQSGHDGYHDGFVEGVHVNLLVSLLGSNAYTYIDKFKALANGKKVSFNWAAFFFAPYWFFYRKLYKAGIIFMTLIMAVSIAFTPVYMDTMEKYVGDLTGAIETSPEEFYSEFGNMTEDEMLQASEEMLQAVMPLLYSMLGMLGIMLVIHLVAGFMADKLYKKEVFKNAQSVIKSRTKGEGAMLIARLGGVSFIGLLLSYLLEQLLSYVVSSLMF